MLQTRNNLLRHIELTSEQPAHRMVTLVHLWSVLSLIMPQRTVYAVVRPAVIFVLCFAVGTGGWITTVSASLRSLPGDTLYPVKMATEQTQAAVVGALQGRAAATELRLSFATRRAEEVQKVVNTRDVAGDKKERVNTAVENLKIEVQQVSVELQNTKSDSSPEEAAAVAKQVERKIDEIKQTLADSGVSGVHASSVQAQEAVSVINKLKVEAGQVRNEVATATTTILIMVPSPTAVTSTVQIIVTGAASSTAPVAPVVVPKPRPILPFTKAPEKLIELGPDVTDKSTPVTIEAWE